MLFFSNMFIHLVAASSSILKDKQSEHELHITYNEKLE